MAGPVYKVIFCGIKEGHDAELVKQKLATLYKSDVPKVERLFFTGKTVSIKSNVDLETAKRLCNKLTNHIDGANFKIAKNSLASKKRRSQEHHSKGKNSPLTKYDKALTHYKNAVALRDQYAVPDEGILESIIRELKQAIKLGIPDSSFELIDSYSCLAYSYASLYATQLEHDVSKRAYIIKLFEKALVCDFQNEMAYFSEELPLSYLECLDMLYVFEGKLSKIRDDTEEAIEFLTQKLEIIKYLPMNVFPILPGTHLELGDLCMHQGETGRAEELWQTCIASEERNSKSLWQNEISQKAQKNCGQLETVYLAAPLEQIKHYNYNLTQNCRNCLYRGPQKICGCSQSPFYSQSVEIVHPNETSCKYFKENPAHYYFGKGLGLGLVIFIDEVDEHIIRETEKTTKFLERSLEIGLPEDDEINARKWTAVCYKRLGAIKYPQSPDSSVEFSRALFHLEKAVRIDFEGEYKFFADRTNLAILRGFDLIYARQATLIIKERDGLKAAIQYAESKVKIFEHLSSHPMLLLLLELSCYYADIGEQGLAIRGFQRLVSDDFIAIDKEDENYQKELDLRQKAKKNLETLKSISLKSYSLAEKHFNKACKLTEQTINEQEENPQVFHTIIQEFEKALEIGLEEEDEMTARALLGYTYVLLAGRTAKLSPFIPEFNEAAIHYEKAAFIDFHGGYNYFSKCRFILKKLDIIYSSRLQSLCDSEGIDYAIDYAEDKLHLFGYLSSPPLLRTLFELGNLYLDKVKIAKACECWQTIVNAKVVAEDRLEAEVQQDAAKNLQTILVGHKMLAERELLEKRDNNSQNTATDHLAQGFVYFLRGNYKAAITELQISLKVGFSEKKTEIDVLIILGNAYFFSVEKEYYETALPKVIEIIEKAIKIDFDGGYNYFFDIEARKSLERLDLCYNFMAEKIAKTGGVIAEISYRKQKVHLLNYIETKSPLLLTLGGLGLNYVQTGEKRLAEKCWRKLLSIEPISNHQLYNDIMQKTRYNLKELNLR